MNKYIFLALLLMTAVLQAEELPSWTKPYLDQINGLTPPEGTEVWQILNELTVEMRTNGKLNQKRRIINVICTETGVTKGSYFMLPANEGGVKIKKLKGWSRSPLGRINVLEKDNLVTLGASSSGELTTGTITVAAMEGLTKGSIVVFESQEIVDTMFVQSQYNITSSIPTREYSIRLEAAAGKEILINPVNLEKYGLVAEKTASSITIRNIPAFEDETLSPDFLAPYPYVIAGFSTGEGDNLASWDHLANWYLDLFRRSSGKNGLGEPATDVELLKKNLTWFDQNMTYRQVYMSSERGWTPEAGEEVSRRAYGDCKDMVSCLAWRGAKEGLKVLPVLASIADGNRLTSSSPVQIGFNHLIAAIELGQTMNLPAEVEAAGKRYLIFDPTSKFTPFGVLPAYFHGRSLLLCSETGAQWIDIPDSALEKAETELNLKGELDANFTLSGTLEVLETGNDLFLRSTHQGGNDRDLMRSFRSQFDIPGVVDLEQVSSRLDEQNRLNLTFKIKWPSFLRRDAGGLRLPFLMSGYQLRKLVNPGKERKLPIFVERTSPIKRTMEITSTVPLRPGMAESSGEKAGKRYSWTAQGGTSIKVTYVKEGDQQFFVGETLEVGLKEWDSWAKDFNGFWTTATLFYPE